MIFRLWDGIVKEAEAKAKELNESLILVVEHVHGMIGDTPLTANTLGIGLGLWMGIAGYSGIELVLVKPAVWKKALKLKGKDKEGSRLLAIKLFPYFQEELKYKKDHGLAEALLIGHWYETKGKTNVK